MKLSPYSFPCSCVSVAGLPPDEGDGLLASCAEKGLRSTNSSLGMSTRTSTEHLPPNSLHDDIFDRQDALDLQTCTVKDVLAAQTCKHEETVERAKQWYSKIQSSPRGKEVNIACTPASMSPPNGGTSAAFSSAEGAGPNGDLKAMGCSPSTVLSHCALSSR